MPDNPSYAGYKRLSYFTTQLLTERDFKDEQSFHLEMMRRHNAKLHIAGVIEGLDVGIGSDNKSLTLTPGSAIDPVGREIVLVANATFQQPNFSDPNLLNKTVAIVISWNEQASTDAADQYTGGTQSFTRWVPVPAVSVVPSPATPSATNPFVVLAQVSVGADGKLSNLDTSVKLMAGSRITRGTTLQLGSLVIGPANQKWTPYPKNGPLTIMAPNGNDWLTLVPGSADTNFFLRNDSDNLLIGYVARGNTPQNLNHLTLQSSTGNVGVGTLTATDRLTVASGALAFQKANEARSIAGLDYDATSDALRVRFNPAASDGALSTTALSIERQTGNVKIPTGSLEITAGDLNVPVGNVKITSGDVQVNSGNLSVAGGALAFRKANETRFMAALDYDATSDALRVRLNPVATGGTLSSTALSIERKTSDVKIPTGSLEITQGNLAVPTGSLGVMSPPDLHFVVDVTGPTRIKNRNVAGLMLVPKLSPGPADGIFIGSVVNPVTKQSMLVFADAGGNIFMQVEINGNITTMNGVPIIKGLDSQIVI